MERVPGSERDPMIDRSRPWPRSSHRTESSLILVQYLHVHRIMWTPHCKRSVIVALIIMGTLPTGCTGILSGGMEASSITQVDFGDAVAEVEDLGDQIVSTIRSSEDRQILARVTVTLSSQAGSWNVTGAGAFNVGGARAGTLTPKLVGAGNDANAKLAYRIWQDSVDYLQEGSD